MTHALPMHAADRLIDAIDRCDAPICVGIDPVLDRLPDALDRSRPVEAIRAFTLGVLDAVSEAGVVPCVKFQSACFERFGHDGVHALEQMVTEAKLRGLEVILDAKRGDIGITAQHYAAAAFNAPNGTVPHGGPASSDWLTINSYLGPDAIEPFLVPGRGCFALVRTSNPGSDALQTLRLESGETVAECIAKMVARIGEGVIGDSGFSALGAVVGATKAEDAARLRELMPDQIFLVPGYGAQGGSAKDVVPCFLNAGEPARKRGAIVTASRSVIYAYEPGEPRWVARVTDAAKRFAGEISDALA